MSKQRIYIAIAIVLVSGVLDVISFFVFPPFVRLKNNGSVVRASSLLGFYSKDFPTPKSGNEVGLGKYAVENRNDNILLTKDGETVRTIN